MVLLIRDNECFEPRIRNYLDYFRRNQIAYHVLGWNRAGNAAEDEHITYYERRAQYGKGTGNIGNKLRWMWFVAKQIIRRRKQVQVLHACDYDAVLPAMVLGKLLGKKVVFDIFDWLSAPDGGSAVYSAIEWLQNFAYKHADFVIVCDEDRKQQARVQRQDVHVLPNIPNFRVCFDAELATELKERAEGYRLVLSYVGVFDDNRGLQDLLESVARCPDILLNIAGFGMLEEQINHYAGQYPNIRCLGRVKYAAAQTIMKHSDAIVAMYYLTNPVHRYAAPNKYFESLVLGVPLITTKDTAVGNKVERHDTGFAIGESEAALEALLRDENRMRLLEKKRENCAITWKNCYETYYDDFMSRHYMQLLCRD